MEAGLKDKVVGDRYRVLDLLGEGAMGAVYLARDLQLPRQVALKVMRKEWVTRPDVRQRLENECGMMAHMGPHNHIVTLYDRIEFEGDVILVMEFVPGESLEKILERTCKFNINSGSDAKTTPIAAGASVMMLLEPDDAVDLVCQCLEALDFAHSKGVIHRDIKPSNIMVMRDHNGKLIAKLMDFGIGKMIGAADEVEPGPMLTAVGGPGPGTPDYMAPEQFDAKRFGAVGYGADLYAMGVTLYEMLTLTRPFKGTYTELMYQHTSAEPANPRKLNLAIIPERERVLARALKKHTAERYQSAAEFKMDLMGSPVSPPPPPPPPLPRRLIVVVALLLVLMAAAGATYYYLLRSKEPSPVPVPPVTPTVAAPATPEPASPATPAVSTPATPDPATPATPAPNASSPSASEEATKAEQERVAEEAETARKQAEARWAEQKVQEEKEAAQKAEEARNAEEARKAEEAKRRAEQEKKRADEERAAQRAREEAESKRIQEENKPMKTQINSNSTGPATSNAVPDWAREVTVKSDSVVHK